METKNAERLPDGRLKKVVKVVEGERLALVDKEGKELCSFFMPGELTLLWKKGGE